MLHKAKKFYNSPRTHTLLFVTVVTVVVLVVVIVVVVVLVPASLTHGKVLAYKFMQNLRI